MSHILLFIVLLIPGLVAYTIGNVFDGWLMKILTIFAVTSIVLGKAYIIFNVKMTPAGQNLFIASSAFIGSALIVWAIAVFLKGRKEKIAMTVWLLAVVAASTFVPKLLFV